MTDQATAGTGHSLFLDAGFACPKSFAWYSRLSASTAVDGFSSEYFSCSTTVNLLFLLKETAQAVLAGLDSPLARVIQHYAL